MSTDVELQPFVSKLTGAQLAEQVDGEIAPGERLAHLRWDCQGSDELPQWFADRTG